MQIVGHDRMKLFNKFLVLRRDNSVPEWPWIVLGAADPAAPFALEAYANNAEGQGMDKEYCEQVRMLARRFREWRTNNWSGNPDAEPHREDDPQVVNRIPKYATELPKD